MQLIINHDLILLIYFKYEENDVMTVGQALKIKRKELGLSQKQMAAGVISRAQYGKIEKDQHDISFVALLSILCTHNIDIINFINQIDSQLVSHHKLDESLLSSQFTEAFYANDLSKINSLQEKIASCENEEFKIRVLLAKATLEGSFYDVDSCIGKKIREYIFSNENWTSDVIALRYFGSSMPLLPRSYLDLHIKQLLKKYASLL